MKLFYVAFLILFFLISFSCFSQNVGIGITNPAVRFHVVNGTTGPMLHPYETAIIESDNDNKFGIYSTLANPANGGSSVILGYSNFKMQNNLYPNYEMQQGQFTSGINTFYMRFNAVPRNDLGNITSIYQNVMVMDNSGHVGINLFNGLPVPQPTANLHVNGTVRFQGLATGGGNYLVVDGSGNVFQSSNAINNSPVANQAMTDELNYLKDEVANLKNKVDQLMQMLKQKNIPTSEN